MNRYTLRLLNRAQDFCIEADDAYLAEADQDEGVIEALAEARRWLDKAVIRAAHAKATGGPSA